MRGKRLIAVVMAVGLFFSLEPLGGLPVVTQVEAATVSEMEKQQKELQQKINENKKALNDLAGKADKEEAYQKQLDSQISYTKQKITLLEDKIITLGNDIETKNQEIVDKQAEIEQKQADIDESYEVFKTRMRAMYMAGETSSLEMLFSAESFGDFLTNIELVQAISASDQQLITNLGQQKVDLETEKAEIENILAEIEKTKENVIKEQEDMRATKADLDRAFSKSKSAQQDFEMMEQQYKKDLDKNLKEEKAVEAEIQKMLEEIAKKNQGAATLGDGKFIWPVPGHSNISSPYGPRWGGFHSGMDISGGGINGKNIIASSSGTVIVATSHYSYGNYVMVDHGGGYTTLYAHASSLLVSVGQTVEKGQAIAKVGSTGNSTGPHLHFEVRINGKTQNPRNYVSP